VKRSPTSQPGRPQLVGDLVSGFLERSGLAAKVEAATVITDWAELVGPQIAAVTRAQRLSGQTLFVAVTTSAWMMELTLMKADLMRRINAGKRVGRVEGIVFVMEG
jgi:predicted nucleic acid-binding Zn ribbon protein